MKTWRRRIGMAAVWFALTAGLLAVLAPFVPANGFRAPLQEALERALGRKVEIGEVHYRIIPSTGLTAQEVTIHDDPGFGLEPLAYVDDLQVRLSWINLLHGRIGFRGVRLIDASVNLARNESGGWNFQKLLGDWAGSATRSRQAPALELRNARINFRNSMLKSPFYINGVDLDALAVSDSGGLDWEYEGSPARTDRSEQGFGRFTGRGRWRPELDGGQIDIALNLESSITSEVMMLVAGRDLGWQGRVSSRARLFGPLNKVRVTGSFQFEDFGRSGMFSLRGPGLGLPYEGTLDIAGQRLNLHSGKPKEYLLPLTINFQLAAFLGNPTWEAQFRFEDMPAPTLIEFARRLGTRLPEGFSAEGKLNGAIERNDAGQLTGDLDLRGAAVKIADSPPLTLESAHVRIGGDAVRLDPTSVVTPTGAKAEVAGSWMATDGSLEFRLSGKDLSIADLNAATRELPGVEPIPLLETCHEGFVDGTLDYHQNPRAVPAGQAAARDWTAELELANGQFEIPGLAGPIQIRHAELRLRDEDWSLRRIHGQAGGMEFNGEMFHQQRAKRPDRLNVTLGEVDASQLEKFLQPTLARQQGFLERTLRFRPTAAPLWLRMRRIDGQIGFQSLALAKQSFENLKVKLYWDGASIEAPQVEGQWNGSPIHGRLLIALGGSAPAYEFKGQTEISEFKDGAVDLDFTAKADGLGPDLLASLHLTGDFWGRNLDFGSEIFHTASGSFDLAVEGSTPRLKLRGLEATVVGGESLLGQTAPLADGRTQIDFVGARHAVKLVGALYPLEIEEVKTQ
jgi:hypothetical protein